MLSALAAPEAAQAQGWLKDRERAEGPGFRLGNLELHPGLGAEVGYDTNVFHQDQGEQDSAILRITPHLMLSTLGEERRGEGKRKGSPPMVAFRGGISGSLYHYFQTNARTDAEVGADLRLTIAPERPVSFTIFENFSRTVRPFTEPGALDADYARDQNQVGAEFAFGTRGGVFKAKTGYTLGVDFYEGESFRYGTSLTHRVNVGSSWRFFPHTALLYDFRLDATDYTDTDGATTQVNDHFRLRSRVGVNGALTDTFSMLAMVGYGAGFYNAGSEYESVVAQAEARFRLGQSSRLAFGYERDFQKSLVGNWIRRDRGYANFQILLAGAFLLGIEGGVGLYDFGAVLDPTGAPLGVDGPGRSDVVADASLFAEYRVTNWLGFNASVNYQGNFTDFEYQRVVGMATLPDPADYQKVEVWGGVRVFY